MEVVVTGRRCELSDRFRSHVEEKLSRLEKHDHRIIQGAESGQFLQLVEGYLQGEHGFYEQVFSDLGAPLGPAVLPPAPAGTSTVAAPAAAPSDVPTEDRRQRPAPEEDLLQAVQAAMSPSVSRRLSPWPGDGTGTAVTLWLMKLTVRSASASASNSSARTSSGLPARERLWT